MADRFNVFTCVKFHLSSNSRDLDCQGISSLKHSEKLGVKSRALRTPALYIRTVCFVFGERKPLHLP